MSRPPTPRREPHPTAATSRGHTCVDVQAAHAVARCYLEHADQTRDPLVRSAYRQLETQTDALLRHVVGNWWPQPLRIVSTTLGNPYDGAAELVAAVASTSILEVPVVDPDRRHPLLGNEPGGSFDRLRALHDLIGHVRPRFGFDRGGEFAAWRTQHRHHRGLARRALATELHAQHSVLWTTGQLAEPKAVLIDPALLRRAFRGARTTPGPGAISTCPHRRSPTEEPS